jgi:protein TonB
VRAEASAESQHQLPPSAEPVSAVPDGEQFAVPSGEPQPDLPRSAPEPQRGPTPRTSASPPPPQSAPEPESAIDIQALLTAYAVGVKAQVLKYKRYPATAERLGQTGDVQVGFTIAADGALAAVRIKASSGWEELDEAALETVRSAAPFEPIPAETGRNELLTILAGSHCSAESCSSWQSTKLVFCSEATSEPRFRHFRARAAKEPLSIPKV